MSAQEAFHGVPSVGHVSRVESTVDELFISWNQDKFEHKTTLIFTSHQAYAKKKKYIK
jgi:hypothetical protein